MAKLDRSQGARRRGAQTRGANATGGDAGSDAGDRPAPAPSRSARSPRPSTPSRRRSRAALSPMCRSCRRASGRRTSCRGPRRSRGSASPTSRCARPRPSTARSPRRTRGTSGRSRRPSRRSCAAGSRSDILKKLRRGHWALQGEIDLHGQTIDEAHDALSDFIVDARQRGYRCVRAIHGKGLTSPNREPVLKGRVRRWLAHWDEVLAYCEAPPTPAAAARC